MQLPAITGRNSYHLQIFLCILGVSREFITSLINSCIPHVPGLCKNASITSPTVFTSVQYSSSVGNKLLSVWLI